MLPTEKRQKTIVAIESMMLEHSRAMAMDLIKKYQNIQRWEFTLTLAQKKLERGTLITLEKQRPWKRPQMPRGGYNNNNNNRYAHWDGQARYKTNNGGGYENGRT